MMKKFNLLIFVLLLSASSSAQQKTRTDTSRKPIQIFPKEITWSDAKPPLPPGAKTVILEGNPKKEGIYTIRMKFPPHYLIPAHVHPADERVTVLSGSIHVGIGDNVDKKNATHYTAGCFYMNPAGSHHYVFTGDEEVVIQLTGMGPWGIEFIDEKK